MLKKGSILLSLIAILSLTGCNENNNNTNNQKQSYLNFSTGDVNGMYYPKGQVIAKKMAENGYSMKVVSSDGGEQNGRRIVKGLSDFGFIQKDTHNLLFTLDNDYEENVKVVSEIGKEAILFVVNKNGYIKNENDLKNKKAKIVMTSKSSGAVSSLETMGKINQDFSNKEIIYKDFENAIKDLKNGDVDVIMFVQSVKIGNKNLQSILQDKNLEFIDINDQVLINKKLNGENVYEKCEVSLSDGILLDNKIKTICTKTLIITNKKVKKDTLKTMNEILDKNKELLN